jgi:hypothetical protein
MVERFRRIPQLVAAAFIIVAGCAPLHPMRTSSGRPEVVIPNSSREAVVARMAKDHTDNGFDAEWTSEYRLAYVKRLPGVASWGGAWYDADPIERITYFLSETPGGIRIVAMVEVVTDPGSVRRRITDVSGGPDGESIQQYLRKIRVALDRSKAGIIGVEVERGGTITRVYSGSSAERGGVASKDRIIAIDGRRCDFEDVASILAELRGPAGTPVSITLLHDGSERTVSLLRR